MSDIIVTYNSANGAELKFYSDPISVPEPATWAMLLLSFFGLGALLRTRKAVQPVSHAA